MSSQCRPGVMCSHSISRRLSQKLALFTMVVLGLLFAASWVAVKMLIMERNAQDLQARCALIADVAGRAVAKGGEAKLLAWLHSDGPMRADSRLEFWRADGSVFFADPGSPALEDSNHRQIHDFSIEAPNVPGGLLRARYTVDYSRDAEMGQRWALILTLVTLAAGAIVAFGSFWHVKRGLRPLRDLATQTLSISPRQLDKRLSLADPAEELLPWIEQFNALMERLQRAVAQLEAFNADVAHELRTPLATLIGQTEVALSRERDAPALRETLFSNLEEMQRLSALVNDMLFLSQADRGATARRGEPVSLAELARQVCEFHEATLEDAGLALRIQGDARVPLDEPLVKRALSNLVGNATRFARRGSTIVVAIAPEADGHYQVVVENAGDAIAPDHLPRLFDRFFRAEDCRSCPDQQHHGLGLAIVAAIARMHAGRTVAQCEAGTTRVGFTLAPA